MLTSWTGEPGHSTFTTPSPGHIVFSILRRVSVRSALTAPQNWLFQRASWGRSSAQRLWLRPGRLRSEGGAPSRWCHGTTPLDTGDAASWPPPPSSAPDRVGKASFLFCPLSTESRGMSSVSIVRNNLGKGGHPLKEQ